MKYPSQVLWREMQTVGRPHFPDLWDAVALTFARPVAPSNFHRKIVYPPSGLA
jgi:hypothetical protein